MIAVYKNELNIFFKSLNAYLFIAFLLLFVGLYSMGYNINSAYASFEYVLGSMTFIFTIAVPLLTMRTIAEEKRQKTDQLLYSLPISMTEVVLGKLLALVTVYLIPILIIACYPLIYSMFGDVYILGALGAVFGFFLLGVALLSVGMFISSITESQAIAAVVTFVVILFNYFVAALAAFVPEASIVSFVLFAVLILILGVIIFFMTKNTTFAWGTTLVFEGILTTAYLLWNGYFEGLFGKVMAEISLTERYYQFAEGVFDLNSIVFFLSVTVLFTFLTIQSLEKRRWS